MSKVIVFGASGFIGKRLVYLLLEQSHEIYAVTRIKGVNLKAPPGKRINMVFGDLEDPSNIEPIADDIDVAYYLIHSMGNQNEGLVEVETQITKNFLALMEKTKCRQIIFLGGIVENPETLSMHLKSRYEVENVLKTSKIPCTILRSSIIIGAGSASFEIIRDLVEKLPLMVAPKWVKNYCQPIAVSDVLFYLTAVLLEKNCLNKTFDIGGPEVIRFEDVLKRYAKFRNLRRYIINIPLLTPRLSSYWLVFITSVKFSICRHLVESLKQNTRKLNDEIDLIIPRKTLSFEEALHLTFQKIEQNEVVSTWMDAWEVQTPGANIEKFLEVPEKGCLKDYKSFPLSISAEESLKRIFSLGGETGWHSMTWAWMLRGYIDKFIGGVGFNRGRRHPLKLEVGDSVDFWRVLLADSEKKHLVLYAEMKLPGEAWLEFVIDEKNNVLHQVATFRPKGLMGYFYWYAVKPFHALIFKNMGKALSQ